MVDKIVTLHIGAAVPPVVIDCTEGDTMWRWRFRLYLDGARWTIPSGSEATFAGLKKDGNVFDVLATISNNEVLVLASEQITAYPGDVFSVVKVIDGNGKIIATCPVVLRCKPNPQSMGELSDSVISAYDDAMKKLGDAISVQGSVSEWLEDNITEPEGVVIDASLSVSGACADAGAAGKELKRLHDGVDGLANASITWTDGAYINNNNLLPSDSRYSYSDYIKIPANASVTFLSYFASAARVMVYNAARTEVLQKISNGTNSTDSHYYGELEASEDVRYMRMSCLTANKSDAYINMVRSLSDIMESTDLSVKGYGSRISASGILDSADNAKPNTIYTITGNYTDNLPDTHGGTLITANCRNANEGGHAQLFISAYNQLYTRIKWNIGSGVAWSNWLSVGAEDENYSDISMFERFGVVGDSFASGVIYTGTETGDTPHYALSWVSNLARQSGVEGVSYAYGGLSTKTWLTNSTYGLPKLLSDINGGNPCGLYILCLGINDSNSSRNPGGLSYLGSSADIDDSDYTQNADSFWGNYGRIISQIKSASPNSKIVMCNFKRVPTSATSEGYEPFRAAIEEIAAYFEIPCIRLDDDAFFNSSFYMSKMVGSHPTAPQYAGYAKGMNRLLSKCIAENYNYFKDYIGV